MRYSFTARCPDIEDLLLSSLDLDMMLPQTNPNIVEYESNGDHLTVYLKERYIDYKPKIPGQFSTSKIALRVNQWYAKVYIMTIFQN